MFKRTILLLVFAASNSAQAGTEIKKIIDANGHVIYTNSDSGYSGRIIRKFDSEGILHFRNLPRVRLNNNIIKTGLDSYRYAPGSTYPTIYHSFSDRFSPKSVKKSKFSNLIANAAYRHGVEEKLVHAVIQTESAYNASAVSRAGAVGLMQLMPDTARRFGVTNRNDPFQNVNGGTKYLRELLDMFNDIRLAVAAYNAGENAVIKYNNSIPPYPETQNYVRQVLSLYHHSL